MEDRQAIESELNQCFEELHVLQSSADAKTFTFTHVLVTLEQKLNLLVKSCIKEKPLLKALVFSIYIIIHDVNRAVSKLLFRNDYSWIRLLRAIKRANYALSVNAQSATLISADLEKVYAVLVSKIYIQDEEGFKHTLTPLLRGRCMLRMFSDVGIALSDLARQNPNFYLFLGTGGKEIMDDIVTFLKKLQ
jgi:hypothetical protein